MNKDLRLLEAESYIGKIFRNKSGGVNLLDLYIIITDAKQRDNTMISSSISARDKIFKDSITISYIELSNDEKPSFVEECPLSYIKYSFVEV